MASDLIFGDDDFPYVVDYAAISRVASRYGIPESHAGIIDRVAWSVGGEAEDLARVLWHESRMNTKAQFGYPNGSPRFLPGKATGLIQFLETTAKSLGTTTEALYYMSFPEQMYFVEKYLQMVADGSWAGGGSGPLDTQEKMALAVFYPSKRNAPLSTPLSKRAQKANPGVRTLGDYVNRALSDTEKLIGEPADLASVSWVDVDDDDGALFGFLEAVSSRVARNMFR